VTLLDSSSGIMLNNKAAKAVCWSGYLFIAQVRSAGSEFNDALADASGLAGPHR